MPEFLQQQQVDALARDGFVSPIRVFPEEQAQHYRAMLEAYEASVAHRPPQEVLFTLSRFKPHLLFTWLDEICHHPRLLGVMEDLLGPDLLIYSTAFFTKNARDGNYVPWHQDTTYADFEGGRYARAWIALTPSHAGNGCMRVIRGSHLEQLVHAEDPDDAHNILFRKERVAGAVNERDAVDLVLAPGEMSVHDYGVVHGSNPNDGDDRRIGFAITFVTADTRPRGRIETAMLVRGQAPRDGWELEPRPRSDQDDAAHAAHARAMRIRGGYLFGEAGRDTVVARPGG
jgi:ectoine hydroxylase-related dioxygenase (phytanoyl-CoA dioxygenase family)